LLYAVFADFVADFYMKFFSQVILD